MDNNSLYFDSFETLVLKSLFNKKQKRILWFVNSWIGRKLLKIKTKYKVVFVTPNSYHQKVGKNKYKARFFNYNKVAKFALDPLLRLEYILQVPRLRESMVLRFASIISFVLLGKGEISTVVFFSTTDNFENSANGCITYRNSGQSWTTIRNGTSGSFEGDYLGAEDITTNWFSIYRAGFTYDTSSIPDGATISSSTFSISTNGGTLNNAQNIGLVTHTWANPVSPVGDDYDQFGSTEGCDSRYALSTTNPTNYSFALNSTGLSWISKTGYTKLALRSSKDLDNSAPTARNYIVYTPSNADLSVTYTTGSPSPSLSPSLSPSASQSPSASPSASESRSPSASQSPSSSPSASESRSPSASQSPSSSPSSSESRSPSLSPSPSASPSASESRSPSLSGSPSPSLSPSASQSPSASESPSPSATPSASPSASESRSISLSPSLSPSVSESSSTSPSPSATPSSSPSASQSPSSSVSASISLSPSLSPSASPSSSISASPSVAFYIDKYTENDPCEVEPDYQDKYSDNNPTYQDKYRNFY